jgi:hypothetical protein
MQPLRRILGDAIEQKRRGRVTQRPPAPGVQQGAIEQDGAAAGFEVMQGLVRRSPLLAISILAGTLEAARRR